MEDSKILELYWNREECAIEETAKKYGGFCYGIAKNILTSHEDAEECVNDTYGQAWNKIPPERPMYFQAWLGKVVRNIAINLWNKNHAKRRYSGMNVLLDELAECIPDRKGLERELEEKELAGVIDGWLRSLDVEDRILFVRRYWYGVPLKELAREWRSPSGRLASRMFRLRKELKETLEKEGIDL